MLNFVKNLNDFKAGYKFANEQLKNSNDDADIEYALRYLISHLFRDSTWLEKTEHYRKGIRFFLFLYFRK